MVNGADQLEAAVAVLGSMLIDESCVGRVLERVREEDFLSPVYRTVFQAIRALFTAGEAVDPVTVRDRLGNPKDGELSSLLVQLMENTPTSANVDAYVEILRKKARCSRYFELGRELQEAAVREDEEELGRIVDRLNALRVDRRGVERWSMADMLLDFHERHSTPHQYLTWGLGKLDAGLFLDKGDFLVLGGYPSAGKTALAVQFAYHHAKDNRVGFYSLETSRYKLADRLISNLAGIELAKIKKGTLEEEEWQLVADRSPKILERKLSLIDAAGMTAADIRADALAHRYEMIFVDYLQLVEPESRREVRQEQVAGISRDLQQLAHGSGLLVVGLSQLTRQDRKERGGNAEPTMADLRESGQLEQDADAILLLYMEDPTHPNTSRRVCKIAKNKDGERGRVYLVFDGSVQRFRESAVDAPAPEKQEAKRKQAKRQLEFWELPEEAVPWEENENRKDRGQ